MFKFTRGTVEINYKNFWGGKSIYTLYNGDFLPQLVNLTSSGDLIAFLKTGGDTNLNAHAYVDRFANSHIFFFEEGKELLKIPLTINGQKVIKDVSNIYADTADSTPLLGTGFGFSNLIMAYNGVHLKGGIFDNILLGDDSNNTFDGTVGVNNIFVGNGGNDTFFINNTIGIIIDGGSGTDLIDSTSTNDNMTINLSAYYSVENVTGNGNNNVTGNSDANIIKTGSGNDNLDGGSGGYDELSGGDGYDTYIIQGSGTINDSDGKGSVSYGGGQLGGTRKQGESQFVGSDGVVYEESGGTIFVLTPTGTITINAPAKAPYKSQDGKTTYSGMPDMGIILITENKDDPEDPPQPPSDGNGNGGSGTSGSSSIIYPNDIQNPQGFGQDHWIAAKDAIPYTIRYENEATATAPAQQVTITEKLNSDLDIRSFRLGDFGWGTSLFTFPTTPRFTLIA